MKGKGKTLLTLFLITWVVFAAVLFLQNGNRYIGKSFFETSDFSSFLIDYKTDLESYVLTDFNAEEAKKKVTVRNDEIEYYRNYYGSLSEQVENIRSQYEERILEAEEEGNTKLKERLEKERDEKINDITQNFKSDDYVKEKILKIKYAMIDEYAKQYESKKEEFLNTNKQFSFYFKNVDTGKVFQNGSNDNSVYKETYDENSGYYHVNKNITIDAFNDFDTETYEKNEMFLFSQITIPLESARFEGYISIPKSTFNGYFKELYDNYNIDKIVITIIWISAIVALLLLFTIAKPSKQLFTKSNEIKSLFNKLPVDLKIISILICIFFIYFIVDLIGVSFYSFSWLEPLISDILLFCLLYSFISFLTFSLFWTWETINSDKKLIKEVKESVTYQIIVGLTDLFVYRSIATLVIAALFVIFLFGIGFGFIFGYGYFGEISFLALIFACLGLPIILIFLQQMGYLNRIMKHTEQMAEGHTTSDIEVKGNFPLARHASNLNKVREGVEKSMLEQAKSERLKTELITNVSHDLRTPLTSIITYTDLLKNDTITEEERKHYIDVIDKKSARLKTLIEDLFEVSKMASGNIELNKQRLDLCQLLQQAVGEHKEDFENANLELRVLMPDQPVFAYVDGQKWWRVLDNLIVNALKYSLAGTRVYISLTKQGKEVIFTIKNVSSYELTENADELVERFKRADTARNTEGSGLGLAIVQSIVNLHNGKMKIEVDGDLFKVTVVTRAE